MPKNFLIIEAMLFYEEILVERVRVQEEYASLYFLRGGDSEIAQEENSVFLE